MRFGALCKDSGYTHSCAPCMVTIFCQGIQGEKDSRAFEELVKELKGVVWELTRANHPAATPSHRGIKIRQGRPIRFEQNSPQCRLAILRSIYSTQCKQRCSAGQHPKVAIASEFADAT
jgi:hypothetical protein